MSPSTGLPDPEAGFAITNKASGDAGHRMLGVPTVDGDQSQAAISYFNAKAQEIRNYLDRANGADALLADSKLVIAILRRAAV
jgi:hypothetical protein